MKERFFSIFYEYFMILDLNDKYKDFSVSSYPQFLLDRGIKILPAYVDEVVG